VACLDVIPVEVLDALQARLIALLIDANQTVFAGRGASRHGLGDYRLKG